MTVGGIVPRCHIPWQQMVIDSSGAVAPCCYWGAYENQNPPIGNINENSIEEIWNNERFQQLRRGMASGNLELAGCAKCYALKQGIPFPLDYDRACEAESPADRTSYADNIATLKQEVANGGENLKAKPTIVSYTPSHRCNLRCTHCYQESTRTLEMPRDRVVAEVMSLAPYLTRIIAGGGEPFLSPIWGEFLDRFALSINPYLDFATSTNATIVSDKILAGLSRFKHLTINISLDGTGAVYERVRVGAKFAEVRANIRKLKLAVEATKSSKSFIRCSMSVMKTDILDLPNFVKFCTEEGVSFGVSPVITMPPDESLRCFNNDPAVEMRGWEEALAEAKALVPLFFPTLAKIRQEQDRPYSSEEIYLDDYDVLKSVLPFELMGIPHQRVVMSLPRQTIDMFERQYPGQSLVAYIFKAGEQSGSAPYWAPIQGRTFAVSLPAGDYCVNIATKWANAAYWDALPFTVRGKRGRIILAKWETQVWWKWMIRNALRKHPRLLHWCLVTRRRWVGLPEA